MRNLILGPGSEPGNALLCMFSEIQPTAVVEALGAVEISMVAIGSLSCRMGFDQMVDSSSLLVNTALSELLLNESKYILSYIYRKYNITFLK